MSEENKAIVRRLFDRLWQNQDLSIIDEYIAADYVDHNALPGLPPGRDGFKAVSNMLASAFTDPEVTIEDQIAEGDVVVSRWSSTSTNSGEFMGVPATGKQVSIKGIDIARIKGGQVVESWSQADMMGLMQQLGAVPGPE
jgi:predicted ester cyclase